MKRPLSALVALLFLIGLQTASAQSRNEAYGDLLAKYVSAGPKGVNLVDYKAWKADDTDIERLDGYLEQMQALKPSEMSRDAAFVYWVNLYNAATLKIVLDHYPVDSIRDIESTGTGFFDFKAFYGPWRTPLVTVEGREMSLDDIEHETLRKQYDEPRIHYAVNCASIGCPNLKLTPWTVDTLEADLDAAAKAYVNHPRGATVRPDGGLVVSSIYIWFQEDFGENDDGVIRHLAKYAEPALKQKLQNVNTIAEEVYNWALNSVENSGIAK